MSGISQIQVSFLPIEDRILLRLNTVDASGFQFLLTRRYVRLLWPLLLSMLSEDQLVKAQSLARDRQAVLSFQHQVATQNMDYTQAYEGDAKNQPLGKQPVLLSKAAIRDDPSGKLALSMQPEHGPGIDISLETHLLHSFCKLLQDIVVQAQWDIDLVGDFSLSGESSLDCVDNKVLN